MGANDDMTRRRLLRASATVATGLAAAGTAAGRRGTDGSRGVREEPTEFDRDAIEPIPPTDVTPSDDGVTVVPEADEGIRPGSAISSDVGGCTTNFLWRPVGRTDGELDESERDAIYIGTAGHCLLESAPAAEMAAHPGEAAEDVSDLTVTIDVDGTFGHVAGALETVDLGPVVYARQSAPDGSADIGHDFGLIRVPDDLRDQVNPSLPQFGGPHGVVEDGVPQGDPVHMYGNGNGNGEVYPTKGRYGVSLGGTLTGEDTAWAYEHRISGGDSGAAIIGSQPDAAPETGAAAAGVATHAIGGVAPPGMGTTIAGCKQMVERDIGLEIEVIEVGDL